VTPLLSTWCFLTSVLVWLAGRRILPVHQRASSVHIVGQLWQVMVQRNQVVDSASGLGWQPTRFEKRRDTSSGLQHLPNFKR
jgi:hypothetical protein